MSLEAHSKKVYGVSTTLEFGKYKGYTVGSIVSIDPYYLLWAQKNIMDFKLNQCVKAILEVANATEPELYWNEL